MKIFWIILIIVFVAIILCTILVLRKDHKQDFSEQTRIGQEKFHTPIVSGEKNEPKAYLTLPFSKNDAANIKITEGWLYSYDEFKIHGMTVHAAVDFNAPYGTAVYAPVDGYAMSSYLSLPIKINKKAVTYQNKEIHYGFGLFVRMYVPEMKRFLDLGHLSQIDEAIPFSEPKYDEDEMAWNPTNEKVPMTEVATHSAWLKVTKGDLLGKVGTSGLAWGYDDFENKPQRKIMYDPKTHQSWDEPHLHFEEFSQIQNPQEDEEKGQKTAPRDILGIYSYKKEYPSINQKLDQRLKSLILTDSDGRMLFAK